MKIKSITLINIGPYVGKNEFVFDLSDKLKNMVLIGGKNGAGKTTLFNAIKACLYGCIAYGYDSINANYLNEIEALINAAEKLKKNGIAEIQLELLLDDGKYDNIYTFKRKWILGRKKLTEDYIVLKNGVVLSDAEKSNFESYLLQIIPPDLFRFYFFDGEKIGDFVVNSNKTSDFKSAFLKICNLDTMEIIRENFRRISRLKLQDTQQISTDYDNALLADNQAMQEIIDLEQQCRELTEEIISIENDLSILESSYSKTGGISKKEWQSLSIQIAKEESQREDLHKWLKDFANNVLPFIIMSPNLIVLKDLIEKENSVQLKKGVKIALEATETKEIIKKVLKDAGVELSKDIVEKIIYELLQANFVGDGETSILNLSEMDRYELVAKVNAYLSFDISRVREATDLIAQSLKKTKAIRQKMEKSSTENYDDFLQKKVELSEKKSVAVTKLLEIEKALIEARDVKVKTGVVFAKVKREYENVLRKQSVNDIAARGVLAFSEIQEILYTDSIQTVESVFAESFTRLINKADLLDGIFVDEKLNVLPYKNKTFKTEELLAIIDNNGKEFLISQIGMHAYEVFQDTICTSKESSITLPVEVKQKLSAGEKQIFIMALYQALSSLNKTNIPYIIDTPFARIDKLHRANILENFFKRLNGQVIILSTDEEVVDEYEEVIKERISNTFILQHLNDGTSTIKADAYFGVKND